MRRIKIISLILSAALVITGFSGCGAANVSGGDKLSIVTTIFPPYDFARQVAGDNADVKMLVTPGGESHAYEPTPQDIIAVQSCDIFICGGGESDVWTNDILGAINTDKVKVIKMMDCVSVVEEEAVNGAEEDHDGAEEIEYDEHVWTSPKNAILISEAIKNALVEADSDNSAVYGDNFAAYKEKLTALDNEFIEAANGARVKTLVFGDRFPFRYLMDELGLDYYAAFPGCSTETDVSAKVMAQLVAAVKENDIKAVYYIEFSAKTIADTIAAETGAEELLFHSCHTVSQEDFDAGVTYAELMEQNLANLRKGIC